MSSGRIAVGLASRCKDAGVYATIRFSDIGITMCVAVQARPQVLLIRFARSCGALPGLAVAGCTCGN